MRFLRRWIFNSAKDVRITVIIIIIILTTIIIIIIVVAVVVVVNILISFVFPRQPYLAEIFILDEQQVWVISACPPSKYAVKPPLDEKMDLLTFCELSKCSANLVL